MDPNWLAAVRQVVAAVQSSDVTELEIANGAFSVRVRRQPRTVRGAPQADHATEQFHRVLAPLTGIFYRSATPAAKPYVSEHDHVVANTVIGLVETMKIFNEVTADIAGRIVRFEVASGQLVHAGDVLALIEPDADD